MQARNVRSFLILILLIVSMDWLGLDARAASPPKDAFNSATVLAGTSLQLMATNTGATKESGEPNHAGNPGGSSLWWNWTPPSDGEVSIHTDGSEIDTLLALYSGNSLTALSMLATNDDHGLFVSSRVRFEVRGGLVCRIAVDGFSGETGMISLSLDFLPAPIARPVNDRFTNSLSLSDLPVLASGSNSNATREAGEPDHGGRTGDSSVWWNWTAPYSSPIRITTAGSDFDTVLAVYRGSVLASLTQIAANDDVDASLGEFYSAVEIEASAGSRYEIAVDGYDGAMGNINLRIEPSRPQFRPLSLLPNGSAELVLDTWSFSTNKLEVSADFLSWSNLATQVATNGAAHFIDTNPGPGPRFYRASRLP
jgi:hypothetical protein